MRDFHNELDVVPKETRAYLIVCAHSDCSETIGMRIRNGKLKYLKDYIDISKLGIEMPIKK